MIRICVGFQRGSSHSSSKIDTIGAIVIAALIVIAAIGGLIGAVAR